MTKRKAGKTLAERVAWLSEGNIIFWASIARLTVVVSRIGNREWEVECWQIGVKTTVLAKTPRLAKAEALRIVQAAVLQAADEWKD